MYGRRAQYRVELHEAEGLTVTVADAHGSKTSGRLLDVCGAGAGVRFAMPHVPNLVIGHVIDLVFSSDEIPEPLTVAAQVQHRTDEKEGTRRYGFRFLQGQQVETHLAPGLRKFFNRRRGMRVAPDPYEPINVTLQAPDADAPVDVRLENLSELGAKISLETELEPSFTDTTLVEVSVVMPGAREPLEIFGEIRHRQLVGERVHYGIEFNAERSHDFAAARKVLSAYVARRLQDMLRASAA